MSDLNQYFKIILENDEKEDITKLILSNPASKGEEFKKVIIEKNAKGYQISKYTVKQVFHENYGENLQELCERCTELCEGHFRQVNAFSALKEHIILISKKGACTYKVKKTADDKISLNSVGKNHDREKNYILREGSRIAPLVDMGIFTNEGKVVNSMYSKYKQINRFIEILDDEISKQGLDTINVIDFGCGKSYLTFIVYYYLTEIRKLKVNMVGLDLKAEVIKKCNEAAEKYQYDGLKFEIGDINGYKPNFDVDMVLTLHACDTATDYALYNAINWKAKMIFSVPCCQHELNKQLKATNLSILSKYGIIKERFSALATDAIRGNLLEYCGYRTQILEFIDMEHTPKNIMIRALLKPIMPKALKQKNLDEVKSLITEFGFRPKLYDLLGLSSMED